MSKPSFINELSIPAIAAPMFLISGPKLVIECCKNGIVGTFPALNQRTSEGFEEWLIEIKAKAGFKPSMEINYRLASSHGIYVIVSNATYFSF